MLYSVINGVHDSFLHMKIHLPSWKSCEWIMCHALFEWNICTSSDIFYVDISLNMDRFAFPVTDATLLNSLINCHMIHSCLSLSYDPGYFVYNLCLHIIAH
jgi:hypothetical protein